MGDPRITRFTETICQALEIVEDDVVLIMSTEKASPLLFALQKEILLRKAFPEIHITLEQMRYILFKYGEEKHFKRFSPGLAKDIEFATKLISIDAPSNPNQLSKIDQQSINIWNQTVEPFHSKLDFVPTLVTIFPNAYYADKAGMSLEEYQDLFYKAVSIDLEKLYQKYNRVEKCLNSGKEFFIKTADTELHFSLGEGRIFTMHSLLNNLPNGEVFCSPEENSVTGHIQFHHVASYNGKAFPDLFLEFENGVIVNFKTSGNSKEFAKLIETDAGSKKLGKFGFGINPAIDELTNDILFDEKIAGTCNISLGDAYPEVGGRNRSAIHFDIVKDMRNGSEVHMDGKLIYENGNFRNFVYENSH